MRGHILTSEFVDAPSPRVFTLSLDGISEPSRSVPRRSRGAEAMPATTADVEEFRAILRHVQAGALMTSRERMLFDALTKAVSLLAENLAPSVTTWILGALHQSGRWNATRTHWFIHDEDLYNWAMRQIGEMHDGH